MKTIVRSVLVWIAAFAVTYVVMVVLNSVGAAMHGEAPSYGSSRLQQELSGFTRLLIHVIPAIAVAYWQPLQAWKIAGVMSLMVEGVNAFTLVGKAGFPYVGDPLAEMTAYVLLGTLAAYAVAAGRKASAS